MYWVSWVLCEFLLLLLFEYNSYMLKPKAWTEYMHWIQDRPDPIPFLHKAISLRDSLPLEALTEIQLEVIAPQSVKHCVFVSIKQIQINIFWLNFAFDSNYFPRKKPEMTN